MNKPGTKEILNELYKGHGHVINNKRKWRIKSADLIYRLATSTPFVV